MWNKKIEKLFFNDAIKKTPIENLFYKTDDDRYLAYFPKNYKGSKTVIQSRNALIGEFTENYCKTLIEQIVKGKGLFAIKNAVCNEISLTKKSKADLVIARTNSNMLKAEEILAIFEIKMSLVGNWEYLPNKTLEYIGDYLSHTGMPSLLRSDSMLKAIGKAINIRLSNHKANNIPIFVLGNTPITSYYYPKVDRLKKSGIIQGFVSINPKPTDKRYIQDIKNTKDSGFIKLASFEELAQYVINAILVERLTFFSSMISEKRLGQMIEKANLEKEYYKKAKEFLYLLNKL